MTDPDLLALLREAADHLAIEHRTLRHHDRMGANLGCAGCELLTRLDAAVYPPSGDD